jgi:hypothetical protein
VVGRAEGHRHAAADRADEDDPPASRADLRQQRLGHRDLGDQVDLELVAQVVELDRLQRRHHRNAGVVDEAVEAGRADLRPDPLCRRGELPGVGHVEDQRHETSRGRLPQVLRVLLSPNAREHPPAVRVHAQGAGATDPSRGAGDQD